jgi:aryl-alcohol dehydrogenase-like predicted oxidoreductase
MTKVDGRTKAAAKQMDESLKRLQTDHVDLMQFHEVIRMEVADGFSAEGSFTGHKDPAVHLRMLDVAREKGFHFDAVLFPSNPMDWSFRSFMHQVLPVAAKDGIAIQTMKPMGDGILLESNAVTPAECLMYALSQPVSVVIHGMEKLEHLDHALSVVKNFKPLTEAQIEALAAKAESGWVSKRGPVVRGAAELTLGWAGREAYPTYLSSHMKRSRWVSGAALVTTSMVSTCTSRPLAAGHLGRPGPLGSNFFVKFA